MGVERSLERYHCAYGIDPAYVERLEAAGRRLRRARRRRATCARSSSPDHPFFLGTLFQPELAEGARAHPVIRAFAGACAARAAAPVTAR